MTQPTHTLVHKARSYAGDDGKTRHVYQTIGAAWTGRDGAVGRIRLDAVPVAWDGILYLRDRQEAAQ